MWTRGDGALIGAQVAGSGGCGFGGGAGALFRAAGGSVLFCVEDSEELPFRITFTSKVE
jgi:hypothetical protein